MTPQELVEFLAKYGVVENRKEKPIKSRHYNLRIHKDGLTIENIEYLTLKQARELRAEYRKDGLRGDIIEDVTVLADDSELEFHARKDIPIVAGKCNFLTPEATPHKIANDRLKASNKGKRPKLSNSHEVVISENTFTHPMSSLKDMYEALILRKGYEIRNRSNGSVAFRGVQSEIVGFLADRKYNDPAKIKEDYVIRYIGSEK